MSSDARFDASDREGITFHANRASHERDQYPRAAEDEDRVSVLLHLDSDMSDEEVVELLEELDDRGVLNAAHGARYAIGSAAFYIP